MEPLMMIMGILILPLVAIMLIGLPVYGGIYYSLYWVYRPKEEWMVHPLDGRFWDMQTMFTQYVKLVEHSGVTTHLAVPPLIGVLLAAVLVYGFYRHMHGQFSVDGI